MAAYVQQTQSRRLTVLATIVGLHALLLYALASGLARKVVDVIAAPLQTDLIEEIQQEDEPPPPPPPQIERPPVEVPPPEVTIDLPVEAAQTTAISNVTDRPQPAAPPPPPPPRARTPARPDMKRMPSSEDYYPPAAKRAEEQGSATVAVCVGANGRLTRDPSVQASSGFPRLDEGAVKLAKAGRYIAGTIDGQPDPESCFAFKVKFEIKD